MSETNAGGAAHGTGGAEGGGRVESSSEIKGDAGAGHTGGVKNGGAATGQAPHIAAEATAAGSGAKQPPPRKAPAPHAHGPGAEGAKRKSAAEGAQGKGGATSPDAPGAQAGAAISPGLAELGATFAIYFNGQLRKAGVVKVAHAARQWHVASINEQGLRITEPNGTGVNHIPLTVELLAYLLSQVAHL